MNKTWRFCNIRELIERKGREGVMLLSRVLDSHSRQLDAHLRDVFFFVSTQGIWVFWHWLTDACLCLWKFSLNPWKAKYVWSILHEARHLTLPTLAVRLWDMSNHILNIRDSNNDQSKGETSSWLSLLFLALTPFLTESARCYSREGPSNGVRP